MLAIYNDMGFLSSIGEVTVGPGDAYKFVPTYDIDEGDREFPLPPPLPSFGVNKSNRDHWINPGPEERFKGVRHKPGMIAYLKFITSEVTYTSPNWDGETYKAKAVRVNTKGSGTWGSEGWQHYRDRDPGPFGGMFVKEWDNWDRVLLRNSKSRIKKMFRAYYNSRDFKPGDDGPSNAASIFMKNLKARLMPQPGAGLLSWWQRRKLRPSPFNAKGELCDTND